MSKKHNWNKIFKELDCDTYNPKGTTFDGGLNCFTFLLHFLILTGHDVKFEENLLDGYTQDNIQAKWKEDNKAAIDMCVKYFDGIVREISLGELKVGDILLIEIDGNLAPVIYTGNGKALTMLKEGSVRIPLHRTKIISVHRGNNI